MDNFIKQLDAMLAIIIGVLIIFFANSVFNYIMIVPGIFLIYKGIQYISRKIKKKKSITVNNIFLIILGALIIYTSINNLTDEFVGYALASMVTINGLQYIINNRKRDTMLVNQQFWGGIYLSILGAFLFLVPGFVTGLLTAVIGILFIGYGVVRYIFRSALKNRVTVFKNFDTSEMFEEDSDVIDIDVDEK